MHLVLLDETKSSLVDLSDDEDVVSDRKRYQKKIDAIDEASSIRVNGDEIEKKKKEEDEDIVVQPPNQTRSSRNPTF